MQPTSSEGDNMKCVTPMYREYIDYSPEQKLQMKLEGIPQRQRIIPRKDVYKQLTEDPNNIRSLNSVNNFNKEIGNPWRWQTIPCRHCWACKLSYSAEWATRIMYECALHPNTNFFITLTYDEYHLPIAEEVKVPEKIWNKETKTYDVKWHYGTNYGDENQNEGTVYEPHIEKFLHDLRQYFNRKYKHTGIKSFYCAEYGTENHRPHYHLILMNCPLDPFQTYDSHYDENHKRHFKSKQIDRFWDKGIIDIASVEWSNAAYTARYCTKKLFDRDMESYANECKLPEYIRMSRNIGREWYEEHKDEIYYTDSIIMKTVKGNTGAQKPPKAWDRLYAEDNPEIMELVKQARKEAAERSAELELRLSNYTDLEKLKMKAERITQISKMLPREL